MILSKKIDVRLRACYRIEDLIWKWVALPGLPSLRLPAKKTVDTQLYSV